MLASFERTCDHRQVPGDVLGDILADLEAEGDELDDLLAGLREQDWRRRTPAPGWSIAHQVAHLAWTDEVAQVSATDPEAFGALLARFIAAPRGAADPVHAAADKGAKAAVPELLTRWRSSRSALAAALGDASPGARLPWFGPPMAPASMATARLMETWAHGQDVADALGVTRAPTTRLRHIARLAVRARDYAFGLHAITAPSEEFRVELAAPDGSQWAFGPSDAAQRVTGTATDFCLLATRRCHRDDAGLVATGPDADSWLDLVQAFAGPPGAGRASRVSS